MIVATVVAGDTLSKIAAENRTTWQALYAANRAIIGPNPNLIRVGEKLEIPSAGPARAAPVAPTRSVTVVSGQTSVNTAILTGLGAPVTEANLSSLVAWEAREEPGWSFDSHSHNPLNTTLWEPGSTSFNGVGVKRFADWTTGVKATVETIRFYPLITEALQSGRGLIGNPALASEFLRWSGGGYGAI